MPLEDAFHRPLRNLRISVTDRCNLRCRYCMPEHEYVWLPRRDLLHFEEISTLVDLFLELGLRRVRLTGGEPLLRRDLDHLVAMLAAKPGLEDLSLTTNALLLAEQAAGLRRAGLQRVTVSLDTLRRDRFQALSRRDELERTLRGIEAAAEAGFKGNKINTVVMRGFNEDEPAELLAFGRERGFEVRFIEYMDVGGATDWSREKVVPREEILAGIEESLGPATPVLEDSSAPAERFRLGDGTLFGVIASTTAPFCARCDRSRLTADGTWLLCLYAREGIDLRAPLREGASPADLKELLVRAWKARRDRGAEERLGKRNRSPLAGPGELRSHPHLEMHTRGG